MLTLRDSLRLVFKTIILQWRTWRTPWSGSPAPVPSRSWPWCWASAPLGRTLRARKYFSTRSARLWSGDGLKLKVTLGSPCQRLIFLFLSQNPSCFLVLKVGQLLNLNILGASALVVQAPSDNFWVLLSKANFNNLVSGKDTFRPLLLTDITGLCL